MLLWKLATLLSALAIGGSNASVIYDNGVAAITAAQVSQVNSPCCAFIVADDFILTPGFDTITDVHWTGIYTNTEGTPATDDFTIEIFTDAAGLPGASVTSFAVGNAVNRTNAGPSPFGTDLFAYSADIGPLTLAANTVFWLSIFNAETQPATVWFWSQEAGIGNAVFGTGPPLVWSAQPPHRTDFQLTGAGGGNIPEPGTIALLTIGLALAAVVAVRAAPDSDLRGD